MAGHSDPRPGRSRVRGQGATGVSRDGPGGDGGRGRPSGWARGCGSGQGSRGAEDGAEDAGAAVWSAVREVQPVTARAMTTAAVVIIRTGRMVTPPNKHDPVVQTTA